MHEDYGNTAITFEPNVGQTDESVSFMARGAGYALFLKETEAVLTLDRKGETAESDVRSVIRMSLEGAQKPRRMEAAGKLSGTSNYFIGNDPAGWRTAVPNYAQVRSEEVYPGVDLVHYGNGSELEYDFVVKPNADPSKIVLRYAGPDEMAIDDETGDLVLQTVVGELRQYRPYVYQELGDQRNEVAGAYVLEKNVADNEFRVSFELGDYDRSRELIIDPVLVYGSYLGGTMFDGATGVTIDGAGNAYVTGTASSRDFPTTTGTIKPQMLPRTGTTTSYWYDAFVAKINPDGTAIVFSTYFGGRHNNESGGDIELDAEGNIYISGTTMSSDLPTVNAYQPTFGGTDDGYAAKLNPDGSALIYSTYLGGYNSDFGGRLAVEPVSGEATFVGSTSSPSFPTTPGVIRERLCDSPQTCSGVSYGGSYIVRLNAAGGVQFSTLFNGGIRDVKLDSANNAVVAGTGSPALTTPGAYQTTSTGGIEGYLGKISPSGNQIVFGTLLGGGLESDRITGVALDEAGAMYVTGTTENGGFPTTPGAFDRTFNGTLGSTHDGFITKFNPAGTALEYSTYIGGTANDQPTRIGLASDGGVFIIGETLGPQTYPTKNSLLQSGKIFLTRMTPQLDALVFSTFLGAGEAWDLAVDGADNVFVTGRTNSIPVTPNSFQPIIAGGQATSPDDGFILKIGPTDETVVHYAISGTVTDENTGYNMGDYSPVVMTITGTVNRSIWIGYNGGPYYFGNLPAGGNYTVSAKRLGYETTPESAVFNNLGANQFADFTILRNQRPESTITTPQYGDTFEAPASIPIAAEAIDPDPGDTISKMEFVAYNSSVGNVPIGVDTEAPFSITWENVPSGTWALYAYPYDNHGLGGRSMSLVHVFVTEPNGPIVTLTSPTDGHQFNAGDYVPMMVDTSASVIKVQYFNGDTLVAQSNNSPFSMQIQFTELGQHTITAKAFNSQDQSTTSNAATITVNDVNHTISGRITNSFTSGPVAGVTVNLSSSTNPQISGTTTTDSVGDYSFTNIFGAGSDIITVTPVSGVYTFQPDSRSMALGYGDHLNRDFSAVPITGITVVMTSPTNGESFPPGSTIPMAAVAESTEGTITKIGFYEWENGGYQLIAEDNEAPFELDYPNAQSGNHSFAVRAYDTAGGVAQSATVNVSVTTPPTAIRLQGDISDPTGRWMQGITVRLTGTVNGNPVNQTSVTGFFGAYGFFNLTPGGDYTITPEAPGQTFTPLSYTINNAVADEYDLDFQASLSNQPPVVNIVSPTNGTVFDMPGAIQVVANATDDGQVTGLRVTAVGASRSFNIAESNNGNVDILWEPTLPGNYRIWAVATDNGGLNATTFVDIVVNPPAPVSISGRIVNRDSQGIGDVTVEVFDYPAEETLFATGTTDANGNYTIEGISTFANYVIRPNKLDHVITPERRILFNLASDQLNQDFTGTLQVQPADFDGDGMSDLAVWRPSDGVWHVSRSGDGVYSSTKFGGGEFGDVVVPGNYDGDKHTDYAVYRGGHWYIRRSVDGTVEVTPFGLPSDLPVAADFDGDGRTDIAVWRPSDGTWHFLRSSDGGYSSFQFGLNGDKPLAADYDGDGKADVAIWRPSSGVWYVLRSTDGQVDIMHFGLNGDIPVTGDFDGDKRADIAVYRPSSGTWYNMRSSDGGYDVRNWGVSTDIPVPGDYDRDGKTDIAIFRPSEGNWYVLLSGSGNFRITRFGQAGDVPIPSAFFR
ncbi:MAG TPA: Ig-like domain-containing protein [Pyrinomonadaceae bacterium]|nr:Ig-like domain-containing protein [Pyrinomonadaceae bacterium]